MNWHVLLVQCNTREWVDGREKAFKLLNDDVNAIMTQDS